MHTSGNAILWTELEMRKRFSDRKRGTQPGEQVSARKGRQYSSPTLCQWSSWAEEGPSKRMQKKKKRVDTSSAKESMEFRFPEKEGERIEIKGNAQLILNLWTLFSLWTDNTLCSFRKFNYQLYVYAGPLPLDTAEIQKNKFKKNSNGRWNQIPGNGKKLRRSNYKQRKLDFLSVKCMVIDVHTIAARSV